MYKDIFVDSVVCNSSTIPSKRFVGIDGTTGIGKQYGVTRFGAYKDEIMDVIVVGIAEVEVKDGVSVQRGDKAIAAADGYLTIDNTNGIFIVKNVNGNIAEVVLR